MIRLRIALAAAALIMWALAWRRVHRDARTVALDAVNESR